MKDNLKERVFRIVCDRNLCSYMNNTKWDEFVTAVRNEMPFPPPFEMKCLTQEGVSQSKALKEDVDYWGAWSGEAFLPREFYFNIEWIKVRPRYLKFRKELLAYELVDAGKKFEEILHRYNIPYEENSGLYCIYGYR